MLYLVVNYGALHPREDGITVWILVSVLGMPLAQPSNCCQVFFPSIRLNGLEKELMSWPLLKLHPLIKSEATGIASPSLTAWLTFLRQYFRLNWTLLKPIKVTSLHFISSSMCADNYCWDNFIIPLWLWLNAMKYLKEMSEENLYRLKAENCLYINERFLYSLKWKAQLMMWLNWDFFKISCKWFSA